MAKSPGAGAIEVEVSGLSHDGRGVARLDGKTLFVAGALPGERVRARIAARHARFDEAQTLAVLQPSPERVAPPCPHYGSCGGCTLQHLDPAGQLAAHQRTLADVLARIARLAPARWLDPVPSPAWGYRARARLAPGRVTEGGAIRLGFRREDSRRVEPVAACAVLEPALQALLEPLAALMASLQAPRFLHELLLAAGDGPGAAIGFDCASPPGAADLARLGDFCERHAPGLALRLPGAAWPAAAAPLAYAPCDGLALGFAPWHFTQANRAVNRALVASALALLDPAPGDRVLDLFCGIGNFTLALARRAAEVCGVDAGAAELARARENAVANDIHNARFHAADLAGETASSGWARERWDLVLLDPPRAGAARLVPLLARLAPRRICYVACDPATLARDAAALAASGYRLEAAGVLEMFPQTAHFESIALFRR
jgi:23S rRNA (uracil1939-C5)-methyltransferase